MAGGKFEESSNTSSSNTYVSHVLTAFLAIALVVAIVRALLPVLSVVVPLAIGAWAWNWTRKRQKHHRETLDGVFYEFLQNHGGRVTVLDFALTAHLPAREAKYYLDDRAREFAAHFQVSDRGDVIYSFQTLKGVGARDPVAIVLDTSQPDNDSLIEPLSQVQLARRLNLSPATIRRRKNEVNFSEWSKNKDPQGISWIYSEQSQRFYPEHPPEDPA